MWDFEIDTNLKMANIIQTKMEKTGTFSFRVIKLNQ